MATDHIAGGKRIPAGGASSPPPGPENQSPRRQRCAAPRGEGLEARDAPEGASRAGLHEAAGPTRAGAAVEERESMKPR